MTTNNTDFYNFCFGTGRDESCDTKTPHTPHYFDAERSFCVQKLSLIDRARYYKNLTMMYVDSYAVEIQTAALVVAGVVLADRVVRSNQSVKKELRFVKNSIDELGVEVHFGNDEAAFDREENRYQRDSARRAITEATRNGEHFQHYPGVGVFFPGDVQKEK